MAVAQRTENPRPTGVIRADLYRRFHRSFGAAPHHKVAPDLKTWGFFIF